MPSDDRTLEALRALAPARDAFRSAVARAVDEVRGLLDGLRARDDGSAPRGVALGAFAAGRIDVERFDALFAHGEMLDAAGTATVDRALGILTEIAGWNEYGYVVTVEPGHDLRAEVAAALAVVGRAFGAATAVELVRTRRFHAAEHAPLLGPFPAERWNRAERQIAPPLVVEVDGGDLRAGGLAEFLDGAQKLVLVVRGASPPASLVRLITPGVLVAQTADAAALGALLDYDGPAVVALVPATAARFVHDPRGGDTLAARLTVGHMPDGEVRGGLCTLSAFQRREELRQLRALAESAATASAEAAPALAGVAATEAAQAAAPSRVADADPAARLAALLLRQADLAGL